MNELMFTIDVDIWREIKQGREEGQGGEEVLFFKRWSGKASVTG